MTTSTFHLAFPVHDLQATRDFFCNILGCKTGRSAERWIDFDFFGHQLVAHYVSEEEAPVQTNSVDEQSVPVRHFGVILSWDEWHALAEKLRTAGTKFLIDPNIRFEGEVGEQATMFFTEPCGNAIEFKSFKDMSQIFAT